MNQLYPLISTNVPLEALAIKRIQSTGIDFRDIVNQSKCAKAQEEIASTFPSLFSSKLRNDIKTSVKVVIPDQDSDDKDVTFQVIVEIKDSAQLDFFDDEFQVALDTFHNSIDLLASNSDKSPSIINPPDDNLEITREDVSRVTESMSKKLEKCASKSQDLTFLLQRPDKPDAHITIPKIPPHIQSESQEYYELAVRYVDDDHKAAQVRVNGVGKCITMYFSEHFRTTLIDAQKDTVTLNCKVSGVIINELKKIDEMVLDEIISTNPSLFSGMSP